MCLLHPCISKTPLPGFCAWKWCHMQKLPSPQAADGGCGAGMGLEIALWSHWMLLQSAERRKKAKPQEGAMLPQGCREWGVMLLLLDSPSSSPTPSQGCLPDLILHT